MFLLLQDRYCHRMDGNGAPYQVATCKAMHSIVLLWAVAVLSTRLSVTFWYCIIMAKCHLF